VQRTICEYVPVTTTQEVSEVICTPVTKKENRTETYYETVMENVPMTRTVYKCVQEKQKAKVCVLKPVTETIEQTFQVCVPTVTKEKRTYQVCTPVYRKEKRTFQVCVPQTKIEERVVTSTVYDCVPVTKTAAVTTYKCVAVHVPTPCADPCAPVSACGGVSVAYQNVPVTHQVQYTENQIVARNVSHKYQVCVVENKFENRTEEVTIVENKWESKTEMVDVHGYKLETRKEKVQVTSCKEVIEEQEFLVNVLRSFEEKYTAQVCKLVEKKRTVPVEWTEYQMKTVIKKVPVTTYRMQTRVVTECVPYTVCVPVTPAPCGGCGSTVASPAPCSY